MNLSENSKFTICTHCNHIITSYTGQNQICLRQFHSSQNNQKNKSNVTATRSIQTNQVNNYENKLIDTTGNSKLDEFIEETQNNSKYCDDFIEWIPNNYLENVNHLAKGGNSNIFCGTWNLTIPLAIKSIKDTGDQFLNEFKMHHKCRSQSVIPFYGITKVPGRNEYAMVIRRAKYGDLRNYINKFFSELTWADRIEILINISKALKHIHEMNLIHRDFHCKNVLVDENRSILICDFGLCTPVDLEIASDKIQGVLPYIAPEVLKKKPYTKKSEVYSLSMIMWELTSKEPPFSDRSHDTELALAILNRLRPKIVEGTPDFYSNIMEQCWDPDPSKRPDSSELPKLFEEMMDLCKNLKYDTISPNFSLFRNIAESDKSLGYTLTTSFDFTKNDDERVSVVNDDIKSSPQSNLPTNSKEKSTRPERKIESDKSLGYTLSIPSFDFTENDDESVSVVNDDIKSSPQSNLPTTSEEKSTRPGHESIWKEEKVNDAELEKEISTKTLVVEKTAALPAIQLKTDVKIIEVVTSQQQNDGSFELNDAINKQIDISSNETLTNSVLTYTSNQKSYGSALIILKSKTTPETTKKIVENQKPDGSIKLDKTVSDQINISSDNIQSSIQTYGVSDKLKSVPKNVWETALSLRYLTITSQSQDQHKEQSDKAKKYLIEELKDEKLIEELLTTSEKIIVDQSVKKEEEDAVATVKSSTTTEKAIEIVSSQNKDGSLELPDTVSKDLDVESNESLVSSIKYYFGNLGEKLPDNKKLLDTAITLSFLRKTSSTDTSPELKAKVEKAEKYLKTELGSDDKIEKLLKTTDTIVVEHATKKVIKEKAEQTIVQEIQETVTEEESIEVIGTQNKEGSYEKISDKITEKLGEITTENISSSVRITDERVKKFDTKVWNTFITIAYCNKVLGKHKSKWTNQNDKARAWLHEQIKDEKLEKEILESCEKIVAEKASNKKKESSWPSLSTSLTSWGSSWGKYICDTTKLATESIYDTVQHTADTVSSTLVNLKSTTTPETTKKIVENQKPDGSIKLDKTVTDQINISSDNIQSSVQTYGVIDKLISVPKNVWETITSQSQDQHKEQSDKAKKYLIEELKDEKLVEEILTTSEKIIVDQSVKKGKEDAVSTIKSSTTTEKAKEIVSSQKEDGSIELTDTVSKELDVESNESLLSSIKTYFINKGTKVPENKKLIDTAITLPKTELGSEEKIKELLEKTDKVVVDHAAKKVIKEKADQVIVKKVQETVTEEEIIKVIEIQNKEGSYEKISDKKDESTTGWGSGWSKYITDTAKSTTEGILQVAKKTTDSVPEATQPETEPKAEPGWFDNIATTEKANDNHEIEDSRYNTQTYDFSLDDLN